MNLDVIKVISCKADGEPMAEELTFKYVTRPARKKMEGEMLTSILGPHQMKPYPSSLLKLHLTIWGNNRVIVVAGRNDWGLVGLSEEEIKGVARDIRENRQMFFS